MSAVVSPEAVALVRRARRRPIRRTRLVIGGLSLALLGVVAARVLLGDFIITVPDFFRILTGTEIPGASYILMESKLPRAVLGVLVGASFGVGGAIFQTTLRNPLASPDIVGVSVGASAFAVFAIVTLHQSGPMVAVAARPGRPVRRGARPVAGRRQRWQPARPGGCRA